HVSPEAAEGGDIALVRDGDQVEIDIAGRAINLLVPDEELAARRQKEQERGRRAFTPDRQRAVPASLRAYAYFAASADKGAVRIVPQ
ncbi:MAG TPA: dihydroxy-acid dehydratase, partial [Desulfobulbus sp.]|nr:dihydroxy-acid dehydratase [Desulfobulbus sp.]